MAGADNPRVCVVTGARSEYGLMRWAMEELKARPGLDFQLVVTGAHLSDRYGQTSREVEADGFSIDARVPADIEHDDAPALAAAVGRLTAGMAEAFKRLRPDLVLVMGDRYELLAVAAACVMMTIPIAHISGGEVSEGAIDDQIRHAMTKTAHLHFASNALHARRVLQMGEEPWRVCTSGEPGLDALHRMARLSRAELCADLGLDPDGPIGLVTHHPVTLTPGALAAELEAVDAAMRRAAAERGVRFVITHPNADAGNQAITLVWERFVADHPGSVLVTSLGHRRYLSALAGLDFMLGNSSSGLVEAPSFNLPAVNIGERQAGRARGSNVIDAAATEAAISAAIGEALARDRGGAVDNPYGGDGRASARIVDFIEDAMRTRSRAELLRKRFVDLA